MTYTDSTASQSSSQTFNWAIAAPATEDSSFNTTPDTPVAEIDLTEYSNSPDDPSMVAAIVSGPSHGTLTENEDGTYTYTPTTGFTGTDTFTYDVVVGDPVDSNTSTATITAHRGPTFFTPSARSLSYTDFAGQSLTLNDLTTNATDPGGVGLEPRASFPAQARARWRWTAVG